MDIEVEGVDLSDGRCRSFFERLVHLYAAMDQGYRAVADSYGFQCKGCDDNCCMTRFYHHTYVEYLYLLDGVRALDRAVRHEIEKRSREVVAKSMAAGSAASSLRLMCPLNVKGGCVLYDCRPMICRLHGIPHELHVPSKGVICGDGCDAFMKRFGARDGGRLDRTPFYVQMAELENDFRRTFDLHRKSRKTIAEMLTHCE